MPRVAKVIIFLLLAICLVSIAYASVPHQISFQGRLLDSLGMVVRDTTHAVTFRIYSDSTGFSVMWQEMDSIKTKYGLFQTQLGSQNPIPDSIFNGSSRFLSIQLGNNSEMPGRLPIKSEAYSYRATFADSVIGTGDSDWAFSDSNIYRLNGNVGIGTDNPHWKLDVRGGASCQYYSQVLDDGTHGPCLALINGLSGGRQYNVSSGEMNGYRGYFQVIDETAGGLPRMSIDPSGNVGIAIGSYPANLLVNGNVGINTMTPSTRLQVDDSPDVAAIRIHNPNGDNNCNTPYLLLSGGYQPNNGAAIRGFNMGGFGQKGLAFYAGWDVSSYGDNPAIGNLYERLRITPDGNVGIGTTSPVSKLDVAGDIRSTGNIYGNSDILDGLHGSQFLRSDQVNYLAYYFSVETSSGGAAAFRTTSSSAPAIWVSNNSSGEAIACGNQVSGATYVLHVIGYNNATGSNGMLVRGKTRIEGNLEVSGSVSKGGGSFLIDHPIDPENKYLYHSFVESPDMKNIYDGTVTLNSSGEAIVELPSYFEALNKDFRYQLTCIGGFANIYIAEKIQGNQFKIAGGRPGLEVSWQVTGIRKDAWAEANRIIPEVDKKPEDRGKYLYPKELGKSESLQIGASMHLHEGATR